VSQGSSAELRELAAEGLGELVSATGEAALRPFVVQVGFSILCFLGSTVSRSSVPAVSHCRISAVQFPARRCRSEIRVRLLLAQRPALAAALHPS